MKSVSLVVLTLVLAVGSLHAAPAPGVKDMTEAPQFESFAWRVMVAAVPGLEARTAAASLFAAVDRTRPPESGHEAGWRRGFADGRARVYQGKNPQSAAESEDPESRGYEAGWAQGAQLSGY